MTNPNTRQMRDESSAKRFHEAIALHRLALSHDEIIAGRFMAVRLADGSTDNTAYESRYEAMKHQPNHHLCFYPQIPPAVITVYVCDTLLWYARKAHDAGHRPDLDAQRANLGLMIPNNIEDIEDIERLTR